MYAIYVMLQSMSIIQSIKNQFKEWNNPGVNVPLANDSGKPSMTLLFAYVAFIATLMSLIYLHFNPDKISPSLVTVLVWAIALLIYRLRRIDKIKFDLDDKSFEVESSEDKETTTTPDKKD